MLLNAITSYDKLANFLPRRHANLAKILLRNYVTLSYNSDIDMLLKLKLKYVT